MFRICEEAATCKRPRGTESGRSAAPFLRGVGGHGYATVRVTSDAFEAAFVVAPRPLERSPQAVHSRCRKNIRPWSVGQGPCKGRGRRRFSVKLLLMIALSPEHSLVCSPLGGRRVSTERKRRIVCNCVQIRRVSKLACRGRIYVTHVHRELSGFAGTIRLRACPYAAHQPPWSVRGERVCNCVQINADRSLASRGRIYVTHVYQRLSGCFRRALASRCFLPVSLNRRFQRDQSEVRRRCPALFPLLQGALR